MEAKDAASISRIEDSTVPNKFDVALSTALLKVR